jgi:apolipoprotein D and lipocalin family protein
VTAEYWKRDDGYVGIRNTCRQGGPDGPERESLGRAKVVSHSGGAKLKVSFWGPIFVGDYWVLDHDDDYSWSIVGEPSGRFLWILTRDARPSASLTDMLYERAAALGYDTSLLHRTAQQG